MTYATYSMHYTVIVTKSLDVGLHNKLYLIQKKPAMLDVHTCICTPT